MVDSTTQIHNGKIALPDTQWSLLLGQPTRQRWETVARDYWRVVYRYISRFWKKEPNQAKDLTQEFFLSLMTADGLEDLCPEKGRLRYYLKSCLENFLRKENRSQNAQKRGGGKAPVTLEFITSIAVAPASSPSFESEWRRNILEGAFEDMKSRLETRGKDRVARVFREYYFEEKTNYGEVASALGISEDDVDYALRQGREHFRTSVLQRVRESVATSEHLEEELNTLFGGR